MKKILAGLFLSMSMMSFAGVVQDHGKEYLTAIKTYDKDNNIRFKAVFPKISFTMRKRDVLKAMLKIGTTTTIGQFERNGIFDADRKQVITLKRKADGLLIQNRNISMFVTEKELEKVR
ncbi:hypothetical protein [Fusobacterium hominis]|uniref:Uncharacterized protein n=1 Tax=Fusobacterium hominis TaxID=2764326 RepID=A0A7G9GW95_9FUSO|nr:hypothetical protein [Fusobacterium hominis]QNM15077.1 hypothetical protein H9Q81_09205 [Fusobacterium hominis]